VVLMTKYPGKNPNLTDEQVEDWLLRVQSKHPDQIAEFDRERERERLLKTVFPHEVEYDIGKVAAAFSTPDEDDASHAWVARFEAWVTQNFGTGDDGHWEYHTVRGEPVPGVWLMIGEFVHFKDETSATLFKTAYGGKAWWR
jgi:hypothetical protein